jgi:creatinine amidohydrolase
MTARPYLLREVSWSTVRETGYELAILPWGATEAHNYHLPYGTDNYEAEAIAAESARQAWEAGARVIVLPGIPFGVNTGQLDIPLTINLNPSTQLAVLRDIVDSLAAHRVRRLVILNGHGGNDFKPLIRELQPSTDVTIVTVNGWSIEPPGPFFDDPGDHAGELETSMMLHLEPDLVLPLKQAGPGLAKRFTVPALNEDWAWTPRRWTEVTADTGVGDPRAATREKGQRFLEAVTSKLARFLVDFAAVADADMYEDTGP